MKLRSYLCPSVLAAVIFISSTEVHAQYFDYNNDAQRTTATLLAVAINEAIFNRWKQSCGPVLGVDDARFTEANKGWQERNQQILEFAKDLREDFRKSDPIRRAMVDEDFPKIAEAMSNSVALANELIGKRYPETRASWCGELMTSVREGRLDIRNRLDPQLKAFVARFLGPR